MVVNFIFRYIKINLPLFGKCQEEELVKGFLCEDRFAPIRGAIGKRPGKGGGYLLCGLA